MIVRPGDVTRNEILHQPDLWPDTVRRVRRARLDVNPDERPVLTGAGSSAYAATAIAAAWPGARAIPTTDLLLDARTGGVPELPQNGLLISIARSGDSPESVGVVELIQRVRPDVRHLAISCNERGRLSSMPDVTSILLDPRTNDRSIAVTSGYSNLVLAGLAVRHGEALEREVSAISGRTRDALASLDTTAGEIAARGASRVTVLTPPALFGAAREASLKVLEMSDGAIVSMPETFVGVRHGPMTFLRDNELVLCLLSSDMHLRRYEEDLLFELRAKQLGRIVAVVTAPLDRTLADQTVPANAPELPDALRTPFEIVFPQLLAYRLSVALGLNPDVASSRGVINRVVQGVRVHH
jgi:tagatose-6-phosphate ketose/aldose isomerase